MKKADVKSFLTLYATWMVSMYMTFLSLGHFEFMDIRDRTLFFLPVYVLIVAIIHFFILKRNKKPFEWMMVSKIFGLELWRVFGLTFFLTFSTLAALIRFGLLEMTTLNMLIISGSAAVLASLAFYLGVKWKAIQN